MSKKSGSGHIPGLDFIRVFAVLNVTLYHYTGSFGMIWGWNDPPLVNIPYSVGVPAFYVLTGYLVPSLLERRSARLALYNRYARLLPALMVCSLITYLFIWLYPVRESTIGLFHWLANMTMLPNALGQHFIDGAYWTLQSQMYFFLFICFVKYLGAIRHLGYILIAVLIFALISEKFGLLELPYRLPTPFKQGINISLSFFQIGVIHFFAIGYAYRRLHSGRFGPAEITLFALCILYEWFFGARYFPLFLILLGVSFVAIFKPLSVYQLFPIRFLARISYCYYLLHMVIGFSIIHYGHFKLGISPNLMIPVTMIFIGVIAFVIESRVERPAYRFLKTNPPSWLGKLPVPRLRRAL